MLNKSAGAVPVLLSDLFFRMRRFGALKVGWRMKYLIGMLVLLVFLTFLAVAHLLILLDETNADLVVQFNQVFDQADTLLVSKLDEMASSLEAVNAYRDEGLRKSQHALPHIFWIPAAALIRPQTAGTIKQGGVLDGRPHAAPVVFGLKGHDEIVGCYIKVRDHRPDQLALIGIRNEASLGVAYRARSAAGSDGFRVVLPGNGELLLDDLRRIRPKVNIKSLTPDFEACGQHPGLDRHRIERTWYGLSLAVSGSAKLASLPVWLDIDVRLAEDASALWQRELLLCVVSLLSILSTMVVLFFRLEKWVEHWNISIFKVKQEREFLQIAQRLANVGSFQLHLNSGRMTWSEHMYEILELDPSGKRDEARPDYFYRNVHPEDMGKVHAYFSTLGRAGHSAEVDERIEFRWVGEKGKIKHLVASVLHGADLSSFPGWVCGIFQDVTEAKNIRDEIYKLATTDSLTGLPNRTSLTTRIEEILGAARQSGSKLAFVYLDLDNFKDVNDAFGHSFGDMLLLEFSARLKSRMMEGDFLCRQGGDEFLIILKNAEFEAIHVQANGLLALSDLPFSVMGREISISLSMGIAIFPDDGGYYDSIQRKADIAMYEAKRSGRNNYVCYSPAIRHQSERNIFIVNSFRKALESDQFYLEYQPIVEASRGRILSFEALLRWRHPEEGLISPAEFIPLAEQSGFILLLGQWVIREAIAQLRAWLDAGYSDVVLAVNISTFQLVRPSFAEEVCSMLRAHAVPGRHLEIEITESSAMANPEVAMQTVRDLRLFHVGVSVDDFGTGYSSLSYLKKFEINKLKIDRSFVKEIELNGDDRSIVSAILDMARHLGIEVIAEGVESWAQFEILSALQCKVMQGYLFSRARSVEAADALLNRMKYDPEWRLPEMPVLEH